MLEYKKITGLERGLREQCLGFARPARNLFSYLTGTLCLQRCAKREIHKISYEKINERDDPRYKAMAAICCRDRQSWSYCLKLATIFCICNLSVYKSSSISFRHVYTYMHGQNSIQPTSYSGIT